MGEDRTAALFAGPELLRGDGLPAFARRVRADVVAGHGFGDLAALVAADVLDHRDALRLGQLREQFVGQANADRGGGLLAILDIDADAAARCLGVLSGTRIARHDSPERVVLAGTHEQLGDARLAAQELCLDVADVDAPAALHSPAMCAAAARFETALQDVAFRAATLTVYSSVTAAPMGDPRVELARCLDAPVLWSQTVRALSAAGTTRYVEAGSDGMLGDFARETLAGPEVAAVQSELVHAT
jgi:[acyl-carrier-protein] S-malonyltransferase